MKKFIKFASVILAIVSVMAFSACKNEQLLGQEGEASGSIIVSPEKNPQNDSSSNGGDDVESVQGIFIVYDLGECKEAYMPTLRQELTTSGSYTLYTPSLPTLSRYEFKGWKNVLTGETYTKTATFDGTANVYLQAVWIVYGPAVS